MVLCERLKKTSAVLRYLQTSTDTEGKMIIIDVILYSGMKREQEYIGRQYILSVHFWYLAKIDRKILLSDKILHGVRTTESMISLQAGYFCFDSPIMLTSFLE